LSRRDPVATPWW